MSRIHHMKLLIMFMGMSIFGRMAVHKMIMRFDIKMIKDPWALGYLAAELIHRCCCCWTKSPVVPIQVDDDDVCPLIIEVTEETL